MQRSSPRSAASGPTNRFNRLQACASPRSAELAGRSVRLSADVPAAFDVPLAPHHKAIGRWVATRADQSARYPRQEARALIERTFEAAVLDELSRVEIADLRVVALQGEGELPPALAVICDSVGALELGWIEKSNVLSSTLFFNVAPVGWQAAAYAALTSTLYAVLPVFGYEALFEEVSAYYWDGETDDESARRCLIDYHGAEEEDLSGMTLPSEMNARRPEWMIAANAAPLKHMAVALADKIRTLRSAHKALKAFGAERSAWRYEHDVCSEYLPGYEDCSCLPPLTLVPFDQFQRELDDVANHGMQQGFMDVAGLCQLVDAAAVDDWFTSLRLGVDLLRAAQDLIDLDLSELKGR
jgi:hypothetical protein